MSLLTVSTEDAGAGVNAHVTSRADSHVIGLSISLSLIAGTASGRQ